MFAGRSLYQGASVFEFRPSPHFKPALTRACLVKNPGSPRDMAINCECFSGVSFYSDPHYLGSTLGHLIFGTSQIWELASLDAAWESLCIQGARNTGIAEGKHPKQIQPRPSVEAWALILRW